MRLAPARGFTLIEVMIAITILAIVILSVMNATGQMIRLVTDDRVRTVASSAADAQVALARQWPDYLSLDSAYAGVETDTPEPGWTRATTITRIGGQGQPDDYKRVTVVVTGPGLPQPVTRSITVAAP